MRSELTEGLGQIEADIDPDEPRAAVHRHGVDDDLWLL